MAVCALKTGQAVSSRQGGKSMAFLAGLVVGVGLTLFLVGLGQLHRWQ